MAFSSIDGAALELAQQAGFGPFSDETVDPMWPVRRFSCADVPSCADPADTLAKAIEAADRLAAKTTVWLDIQARNIPDYVLAAIGKLAHYPAAVVVTHAGNCSHGPNAGLISPALQTALARCNRGGGKWHPLLGQLVISGSQVEPQAARAG